MSDISELYKNRLLALASSPAHKGMLEVSGGEAVGVLYGRNPLCGDDIRISLPAARFDGYACALCTASCELLCSFMEELGTEDRDAMAGEAARIRELLKDPSNPLWETDPRLEPLKPLLAAHRFPARLGCILLPWETAASAAGGGSHQ